MSELSLKTEQQVRFDLVKELIRQGGNNQSAYRIIKEANALTNYIMAGNSTEPTADFKETVKQVIIESLNSQDDLWRFLEKWLARRLPVHVLRR